MKIWWRYEDNSVKIRSKSGEDMAKDIVRLKVRKCRYVENDEEMTIYDNEARIQCKCRYGERYGENKMR